LTPVRKDRRHEMVRGWESTAAEAQRTERAALMLARTRALSDLQHACAPAQRAMLEQAIADLDRRLKALDS
jgi:hypothetical protein